MAAERQRDRFEVFGLPFLPDQGSHKAFIGQKQPTTATGARHLRKPPLFTKQQDPLWPALPRSAAPQQAWAALLEHCADT